MDAAETVESAAQLVWVANRSTAVVTPVRIEATSTPDGWRGRLAGNPEELELMIELGNP